MEKKQRSSALLAGTDADPIRAGAKYFSEDSAAEQQENAVIRQKSLYNAHDRARIDNNQFFETQSNPLSSKGN